MRSVDEHIAKKDLTAKPGRSFGYFLWRRPMARALWIVTAVFWSGAGASLFIEGLRPIFENAMAGLLYSVLFPPLVILYLTVGWLRQEIDSGRIVLQPAAAATQVRSTSGWPDPTSDPLDVRSGHIHRNHFGLD